jgi:hypothetical protein
VKKAILILVLLALLVGCEPKELHSASPEGRSVELTPVWTFTAGLGVYNVYEFTDTARKEHCYVIAKWGDYRSGVALSCEKVEGG